MTSEDKRTVNDLIEAEGFDYGLMEYGASLSEIKDKKFQQLLIDYQNAHTALEEYVEMTEEDEA